MSIFRPIALLLICLFFINNTNLFASCPTLSQDKVIAKPIPHQGVLSGNHSNGYQFVPDICSTYPPEKRDNTFLWIFGDGNYAFGDTVYHTYYNTVQHPPILKTVPIKDDKEDPYDLIEFENASNSMRLTTGNIAINPSTSRPNRLPNLRGKALRLQASNNPVPGDTVVYIIDYANYCSSGGNQFGSIVFEYDNTIFDEVTTFNKDDHILQYHGETFDFTGCSPSSTTNNTCFTIYFDIPPRTRRTIFIKLLTKPNVTFGENVQCNIRLGPPKDEDNIPDFCTTTGTTHSISQKTNQSHDPNFKTVNMKTICGDGSVSTLAYYIEFQNIGKGPARQVQVIDELHPYLDWGTFNHISSKFSGVITINNNEVIWDFQGIKLRGTGERGYGLDFTAEDTKGWLRFEINTLPELTPCQSIQNQADIIFDCNEVISTTTARTDITCDSTNCVLPCEGLVEIAIDTINLGDSLLIEKEYFDFSAQWYPTQGVQDSTSGTTRLEPDKTTTYTLSISGGNVGDCFRYTLIQTVVVICDNPVIEIDEVLHRCDPSQLGRIVAIATGGQPPYTWQDCSTDNHIILDNLDRGRYTLQVKDANGCASDPVTVYIEAPLPLWVDVEKQGGIANLKVSGGSPPYQYLWSNNSTMPSINYLTFPSSTVTVTDKIDCPFYVKMDTINVVGIPPSLPTPTLTLSATPNLIGNSVIRLQTQVPKAGRYTLSMVNSSGRIVWKQNYELAAGEQSIMLNRQKIGAKKGYYLLKLQNQQYKTSTKLILLDK